MKHEVLIVLENDEMTNNFLSWIQEWDAFHSLKYLCNQDLNIDIEEGNPVKVSPNKVIYITSEKEVNNE